ncbi:hypothetical protein D2N39_11700 [Gemmobacter lutimaris]|uniref:Uncharacterized protein n=1 Tax=Gemmobacter lutimaris TaxID=2306023 RepID=A0A398BN99_9RHOB|nr:hypothetical protein [Gemmobacter lutimaris]RID91892.1 hypothetical protein D2N39_11700 [Gemmobacter lutimaris]
MNLIALTAVALGRKHSPSTVEPGAVFAAPDHIDVKRAISLGAVREATDEEAKIAQLRGKYFGRAEPESDPELAEPAPAQAKPVPQAKAPAAAAPVQAKAATQAKAPAATPAKGDGDLTI